MAPEAVGPAGCWFNLGVVHGADPAALPPGTPTRDVDTAAIWNGWRITMANKALRPGSSDRLRLRIYPERRSVEPTSAPVLAPFGVGETHEVELAWGPSRVWLFVPTLAVGQGWNDPGLTVPDDSRLMFYGSPGGAWLVEDLRASDSE